MLIQGKLQAWGNSYGIRIPKNVAARIGARENDLVLIDVQAQHGTDGFGMCRGAAPYEKDESDDRGW